MMDTIYNILSDQQSPRNVEIQNIINKTIHTINGSDVIWIMKQNKYEKIIPFNFWFKNTNYRIKNHIEHNQYMRIRYYDTIMLTPLVSDKYETLDPIKTFLPYLSLYQPFYPDTFYAIWELLKQNTIDLNIKNVLSVSREERSGSMEAIMFYLEKYQYTYQYNTYHLWTTGMEKYNSITNTYDLKLPKVQYLKQAYKIDYLCNTNELIMYDLIHVDHIHILEHFFTWKTEEMDLQASIFYILYLLPRLNMGGTMIVRFNMISTDAWSILFDILIQYFKKYYFYRPSILNPLNSELYLILTDYNSDKEFFKHPICIYYRDLYKNQAYQILNINYEVNEKNPLYQKYYETRCSWIKNLETVLNHFNEEKISSLEDLTHWHHVNDLKQIKDLSNHFDDIPVQQVCKSTSKKIILKTLMVNKLYSQSSYQTLIKKRAELNYYKRVMDTKPSKIFVNNRYDDKNSYLLTWETLTMKIDPQPRLKQIIKNDFRGEMVTNAWLKMYEMLNLFDNLIPNQGSIKTFHLCEAPGAFISATNHYLDIRNQKLDWYAQTLRPKMDKESNMALEDFLGLISSYPERWIFGDVNGDNSGDITHSEIIRYYAAHPNLQSLDFMTADAGLHCDPVNLNEQEAFLGKINMGQIVCILSCLPVNKSAVIKTFLPMSEPLTISLIYLVTHLFDEVIITKPSTSHCTNSEVYIVLHKYRGIPSDILNQLYLLLDDSQITSKTLLFANIDKTFFQSYMSIVGDLIDRQINALQRNYFYYYHLDQIGKVQKENSTYLREWITHNPISILKTPLKYL